MSAYNIFPGMDLSDALDIAVRTGCGVEVRRGTGEITVRVPGEPRPMQVNRRRKDATRALTSLLRKHVRALAPGSAV